MSCIFKEYSAQIKDTLDDLPWQCLQEMVEKLHDTWVSGKQLFIIGNGGSAATASHMACDLTKNINLSDYPRFKVQSLTDNAPLISALANDIGYKSIFVEQLMNLATEGDVLIAISTSGNSPNVLRAIDYARQQNIFTIGWSGYEGGQLASMVNMSLNVPNNCIEQIEDIHMMLEHMVTIALRNMALRTPYPTTQISHNLPGHRAPSQYVALGRS